MFHLHVTGFPVPKISSCRTPLGMENGQTTKYFITASSQRSPRDGPENARLHSSTGSWMPQTSDRNQWLQVDLVNKMQISGISTQGHPNDTFWVKSYSLRYSNNGVFFEVYTPEQQSKVKLNKKNAS